MMRKQSNSDSKLYFYPPGGKFNKMRNSKFQSLLYEHCDKYKRSKQKKEYITHWIVCHFPGGVYGVNENNVVTQLSYVEVMCRVGQKLRDTLKAKIKRQVCLLSPVNVQGKLTVKTDRIACQFNKFPCIHYSQCLHRSCLHQY